MDSKSKSNNFVMLTLVSRILDVFRILESDEKLEEKFESLVMGLEEKFPTIFSLKMGFSTLFSVLG